MRRFGKHSEEKEYNSYTFHLFRIESWCQQFWEEHHYSKCEDHHYQHWITHYHSHNGERGFNLKITNRNYSGQNYWVRCLRSLGTLILIFCNPNIFFFCCYFDLHLRKYLIDRQYIKQIYSWRKTYIFV